jgi:hypothetical protein
VSLTGALSSCSAALATNYPYALMYFPQGVLNTSNSTNSGIGYAAGWYYIYNTGAGTWQACTNGSFSNSTTGYSTGSPVAITSSNCTAPTNAIASGTYTIPNTEITGPNWLVPGNSMGINGSLDVDFAGSFDASTTHTYFVKWAGSHIGTSAQLTGTATTVSVTHKIRNQGNAKAQSDYITRESSATSQALATAAAIAYATVDTTTGQTLSITMTMAGTTNALMVLESYGFREYPN